MSNYGKIIRLFDEYRRQIKNTWEEHLLVDFSLKEIKKIHKRESIGSAFKRELLLEDVKLDYKDLDIHHFIDNLLKNKLGYKTLIEAVSTTENYLQSITELVYSDYPQKLVNSNPETSASELKLINLIITSSDKEEMITALIEEKIRGIFYGKPTDFFEKDKARLNLGDDIKVNYNKAIIEYGEIIARRNLIIHNSGEVDSKYVREVSTTTFKKGDKIHIDKEYIKNSIIIMRGLSALSTKLILQNIYKKNISKLRVTSLSKSLKEYIK